MRRLPGLFVAMALVVVACAPSSSESVATDETSPSTSDNPVTTSTPATTPATTSPPVATTSTIDSQAALEDAKSMMNTPQLSDGGMLESNGAFAESSEGFTPFDDLEVLAYDDGEHLNFYVEGPDDLVRELVIEFDALDASGRPVADTSYVGDLAINPPPWAVEAQNGNTVNAADNPPPGATASAAGPGMKISFTTPVQDSTGSRLGVHIVSDVSTLEEFAEISIWLYRGFEGGTYSYAHYVQLYEDLIANAGPGLVVAAFFSAMLGVPPPPAAWFLGG